MNRPFQDKQLESTCFEVVDANGAKQLVTLTPQGSMNIHFDPSPDPPADPFFVKTGSDQSNPTTPTQKESGSQLSSPLLQQLLNQQEGGLSRTEFLTLSDKTSSQQQQSSVLMSAWSQVYYYL